MQSAHFLTLCPVSPLVSWLGRPDPRIWGGQDGSNFLIHLVDDDDAVRTTLARLIRLSGYEVREYASGAELLQSADHLDSGCILLDLNMPDADGIAVNQSLKARSIDIPVILVTGAGDREISPHRADVAEVLHKPFRRADLLSVLDRFIGPPNAEVTGQ